MILLYLIIIILVVLIVTISISKYVISSVKRDLQSEKSEEIRKAYFEGHSAAVQELEKALGISTIQKG